MRLEWDGPTSLFDVIPGIWGTRFVPSFHIKEFTVVILEWILMEPKDESMIYKTRTSLRRERGDSPRIGVFSPFRTLRCAGSTPAPTMMNIVITGGDRGEGLRCQRCRDGGARKLRVGVEALIRVAGLTCSRLS